MRVTPLLVALALCAQLGCGAGARHYFRGVERSFYEEITEGDTQTMLHAANASPEAPAAALAVPGLAATWLEWDGQVGAAALHPDGQRVVFQGVFAQDPQDNRWEQTFVLLPGRDPVRVSPGIGKTHSAVFVPGDGLKLAFGSTQHTGTTPPRETATVGDSADHAMDLFLFDLGTGATTVLAEGPGFDGEPSFCPDGRLAFSSARDGDLEIYVIDGATSSASPRRLTQRGGADDAPRVAPDCAEVLFVARGTDGDALMSVPFAGGDARALLADASRVEGLDWSADGSRVVFASDLAGPGGPPDLFSIAADGSDLRRLTDSPAAERHPRLTPDGLSLILTVAEDGPPRLARALLPPPAQCPPWPPPPPAAAP